MKTCINHPKKEALSICHSCGKDYCKACLDDGKEFYYCKNPECQELFLKEMPVGKLSANIICPNCAGEIELSEDERLEGKVHCPQCEVAIDFTAIPTEILDKENFVELLYSLNQGDIALIKSLLDNFGIAYYITGENFLNIDPLIQPARFFINVTQEAEAREALKDFELHIWGTSDKQDE